MRDFWQDKCYLCVHLDDAATCKKFNLPTGIDHYWTREPVRLPICVEQDARKMNLTPINPELEAKWFAWLRGESEDNPFDEDRKDSAHL